MKIGAIDAHWIGSISEKKGRMSYATLQINNLSYENNSVSTHYYPLFYDSRM